MIPKFSLNVRIADRTRTICASVFDEAAQALLPNTSADEIWSFRSQVAEDELSALLRRTGNTYLFRIRAADEPWGYESRVQCKSILTTTPMRHCP